MKSTELRKLSETDLRTRIEESKKELFNLRFRRVTDVIENPRLPREIRRTVAKMQTILRERELGIGPKPAAQA